MTKKDPGGLAIGTGGGAYEISASFSDGVGNFDITHLGGPPPGFALIGPHLKLARVSDDRFGDSFDLPKEHLGKPLTDDRLLNVAKLGLAYLEQLIAEATELAKSV